VTVRGTSITPEHLQVEVWVVDHVLLTPREIELPLGKRSQISAEVTNDDGDRAVNVLLNWRHDADDQSIVKVGPSGRITGNSIGRTEVWAGAIDPVSGPIWARIPVQVTVVPSPDNPERGGGFPRLLLTGRDIDPDTNEVRPGDPDKPSLWQDVSDYINNIWWLNLQSPEAAFAFSQHDIDAKLWRAFHVQRLIEMVTEVFMQQEFTKRGDDERPDYWANHHNARDRHSVAVVQEMWDRLEPYVLGEEF